MVKELEDDSGAVKKAKDLIDDPALFSQLPFLEANFRSHRAVSVSEDSPDDLCGED